MGKELCEIKSGYADRLVRDRRFETVKQSDEPQRNRRRHVFRWPGDRLEGLLIAGPIVNYRRNASYIIETDEGDEVEFFGNQQLHACLAEMRGKRVRIQYVGWQRLPRCSKPRKIYRVWEIKGMGWLAPEVADDKTVGIHPDRLRQDPQECD